MIWIIAAIMMASPLQAADGVKTRPQDIPADLWSAIKEQASPEGLITLGATAALFTFARPQDHTVKDAILGPRLPISQSLADAGTWLGDDETLIPAAGLLYGAGYFAGNDAARETGAMSFEALALGGLEDEVLKYAVQRERPDRADHFSFPSGHAVESFSVAAVIGSEFGWPAGVPAYLAAGFVGYTRLQNNKHWLSDVVAGAGLGIISGRAVWRAHDRKAHSLALVPWLGPGLNGALLSIAF